jgi:hypothetical protein
MTDGWHWQSAEPDDQLAHVTQLALGNMDQQLQGIYAQHVGFRSDEVSARLPGRPGTAQAHDDEAERAVVSSASDDENAPCDTFS